MKKCEHEYSWITYHGTCGYEWCGFSEYHKHQHCNKCKYIKGELG